MATMGTLNIGQCLVNATGTPRYKIFYKKNNLYIQIWIIVE